MLLCVHTDLYNDALIDFHHKERGRSGGHELRDRKRPPHQIDVAELRQCESDRQKDDELSGNGDKHTVDRLAERLKDAAA